MQIQRFSLIFSGQEGREAIANMEAEKKRLQELDEQERAETSMFRAETSMFRQKLLERDTESLKHDKEHHKRVENTLQEVSNSLAAYTDAMVKKRVPPATSLPELATWLETSGLSSLTGDLEAAGWTVSSLLHLHAEPENFHEVLKLHIPQASMRYHLKGVLDSLYSELA